MRQLSARIVEFGRKVWQNQSAIVLIIANLVPLWGVIFAHWSAFQIVWLFWFENVIIGGFNVLKILTVGFFGNPLGVILTPSVEVAETPPTGSVDWLARWLSRRAAKIYKIYEIYGAAFLAAFFIGHYGVFSFVHGSAVLWLLGEGSGMHMVLELSSSDLRDLYVSNFLVAVSQGLGPGILVLLASHAFSFIANFLFKREYTRTGCKRLMHGPYDRVLILQIAIGVGGFFVLALGSPVGVLAILVLFKIALDLQLHLKEHKHSGANTMSAGNAVWYLPGARRQLKGPFTADQIVQALRERKIDVNTLCWREGMPAWLPLGQIAEFAQAASSAGPAPPTVPAATPPPRRPSA